jgi:hypothetical protein
LKLPHPLAENEGRNHTHLYLSQLAKALGGEEGRTVIVAAGLGGSAQENYQKEGNPPGRGSEKSTDTVYGSSIHP